MISESYKTQLKQLHKQYSGWGVSGQKYLPRVQNLIDRRLPRTLLDYGCGKGYLTNLLRDTNPGVIVDGYDPGFERFSKVPMERYDAAVCIDVLEHVEPEHIRGVIQHLAQLSRWAFVVVSTALARKTLPDGRNAHLIVEPYEWWAQILPPHTLLERTDTEFQIEW